MRYNSRRESVVVISKFLSTYKINHFKHARAKGWNLAIDNLFVLSVGLYIASVFVFSYDIKLNYISQICFMLMAFSCLLYIIHANRGVIVVDQSIRWFFGILVLSTISIIWSFDRRYAIGKVITVLQLVLMGIAIYIMVDNGKKIKIVLNGIIVSGYFMYIYTFQQMGLAGIMSSFKDNV